MAYANLGAHLADFVAKLGDEEKNIEAVYRATALDLFARTVFRTPVDEAILVANWNLTIGQPDETATNTPMDVSSVIDAGLAGLSGFTLGDQIWLTNPSPYSAVWEFGTFVPPDPGPSKDPRPGRLGTILVAGGFSTQAPQGMLGVSIEEIIAKLGS